MLEPDIRRGIANLKSYPMVMFLSMDCIISQISSISAYVKCGLSVRMLHSIIMVIIILEHELLRYHNLVHSILLPLIFK